MSWTSPAQNPACSPVLSPWARAPGLPPLPQGSRRHTCGSPGDIWLKPSARSAAEAAKNNPAVLKEQVLLMQIPNCNKKNPSHQTMVPQHFSWLNAVMGIWTWGFLLPPVPYLSKRCDATQRGTLPAAKGARPCLGASLLCVTRPLINNRY